MNYDLKIIKDNYGEKMMHLCREIFPTLLEKEGLLSSLLLKKFNPSKYLYQDLINSELVDDFKNYIYSLVDVEKKEIIKSEKSVRELLSEAGYDFYECKTEEDIQNFKKYYEKDEELCTFQGGRLNRCHVFWVVKKDVDDINRNDFKTPKRDDMYGTSVMSIQFTKGNINTLSIKNRYNHTVNNPDATLSNNLENIISGLTECFENEYNLQINQSYENDFEIPNYVRAGDGKYYKYNHEINNTYYCPDNIIIDNFEVKKLPKERYIVLDYFVLDLKEKTIKTYKSDLYDSFTHYFNQINKINIIKDKENGNKRIEILVEPENNVIIDINKENTIIGYKNENITNIGTDFLKYNETLKSLYIPNIETLGNCFLFYNRDLETLDISKTSQIGNYCLYNNEKLNKINANELVSVGSHFLYHNKELKELEMPKLEIIGSRFVGENEKIQRIKFDNLKEVETGFLEENQALEEVELPSMETIGADFIAENERIKKISIPKAVIIRRDFLRRNSCLTEVDFPEALIIEDNFICQNKKIEKINMPKVEYVGNSFLRNNENMLNIELKKLERTGNSFMCNNAIITSAEFPSLKNIGYHFLYSSKNVLNFNFSRLSEKGKKLLKSEMESKNWNQEVKNENQIYDIPIIEVKKTNIIVRLINKIFKKDDNVLGGNHIR